MQSSRCCYYQEGQAQADSETKEHPRKNVPRWVWTLLILGLLGLIGYWLSIPPAVPGFELYYSKDELEICPVVVEAYDDARDQGIIPIHFERAVKPSFPRRWESTPWPHIYGGITVTWY